MCGAVACFACLDTMAKYLGSHMEPVQVVGIALRQRVPAGAGRLQSVHPARHAQDHQPRTADRPRAADAGDDGVQLHLRSSYLQLDEALSILFSTPFLVAIMAGAAARRMGRLAALDRDRRRLHRRAGGDPAGLRRRHAMGRAALGGSGDLLRRLRHRHPDGLAHRRFQRDDAVLCQPDRRPDHAAGAAVRLDRRRRRRSTCGCCWASAPSARPGISC